MRIEKVFIGEDGKIRKLIKIIEGNSVVFVGGVCYGCDFQTKSREEKQNG